MEKKVYVGIIIFCINISEELFYLPSFPSFHQMVFLTFSSGYFIYIFIYLNIYTEQGSCRDQISSEGWEQKGRGVCAMFCNILMTQSPFWHEKKTD